ncbi:FolC bifunctional protein [Saccharata proteae CBS 121410]|uniref:FolC bifunctional protein n=1 Tax=Saccharata proteae CBS 121410 TaxID=1314787 RepID=A0A9P4HVG2_9PEZI|nr:FolC bifunctional protein [Saccharata proteae CBS 121410]
MIELGLSRISRLLAAQRPFPWRAIHVAGTNGKGSICTAISKMLSRANVTHGCFTSPHLITPRDCISLNGSTVTKTLFREVSDAVNRRNKEEGIAATEFELLTATAFEIFNRADVEVGVVETGMGGRLDATNIIEDPLVTVISKIGLDHQGFLGNTIEAIAKEKAGILKPGALVVVDGSNLPSVLEVIIEHASSISTGPVHIVTKLNRNTPTAHPLLPHQLTNLSCAQRATTLALTRLSRPLSSLSETGRILDPADTSMPGRLQHHSIAHLPLPNTTRRESPILIDGAHNPDSCAALATFLAPNRVPIVWLLGISAGRDIAAMLRTLLRPGDTVLATAFSKPAGMPWVSAMPSSVIVEVVQALGVKRVVAEPVHGDMMEKLGKAVEVAREGSSGGEERPIVVAGSLYLVGDVLRAIGEGTEEE